RHDFWPRPLFVGTHPTVTTCKANTGKTPRFLRFTEPCDKCGVGQLAMAGRPAGRGNPRPVVLSRRVGAACLSTSLGVFLWLALAVRTPGAFPYVAGRVGASSKAGGPPGGVPSAANEKTRSSRA